MFASVVLSSLLLVSVTSGYEFKIVDKNSEAAVDSFVKEIAQDLHIKQQVSLPNVEEKFTAVVNKKSVQGKFIGKNGWVHDFSTLKRAGRSEFIRKGKVATLGITLSLGKFEFGFDEYSVTAPKLNVHGKMQVFVKRNTLFAGLSMTFNKDGTCKTILHTVGLKEMKGFPSQMTGLSQQNYWLNKYASTFTSKYVAYMPKLIASTLGPVIKKSLLKKDICKQFI